MAGGRWPVEVDGDRQRLPSVLHGAPAAVLMIDPRRREVVYAWLPEELRDNVALLVVRLDG